MSEVTSPEMQQMVKWREQYVSASLNKKFFGILNPGIYKGFKIESCSIPQCVKVTHGEDANSVAIVNRDGYSITVIMSGEGYIQLPSVGTWYIVLEAFYSPNEQGYQRLIIQENITSSSIVLAKVVVTELEIVIDSSCITEGERSIAKIPSMAHIQAIYNDIANLSKRISAIISVSGTEQEGDIITLPNDMKYMPNCGGISLYYLGLRCEEGEQFEEVIENDSEYSSKIRILFAPSKRAELIACVSGHSSQGTIPTELEDGLVERVTSLEANLFQLSEDVAYANS